MKERLYAVYADGKFVFATEDELEAKTKAQVTIWTASEVEIVTYEKAKPTKSIRLIEDARMFVKCALSFWNMDNMLITSEAKSIWENADADQREQAWRRIKAKLDTKGTRKSPVSVTIGDIEDVLLMDCDDIFFPEEEN